MGRPVIKMEEGASQAPSFLYYLPPYNCYFILKGVLFMPQLIFSEKNMIEGNIFKYEQRLQTHLNKYTESGAILTTYFSQNENESTVDRGLQTIDELFGNKSPLRFNKISNLPLYGFGQANPDNTDDMQIEDINVEGDCQILPATIVPKPHDVFMINHLKMIALFEVTSVFSSKTSSGIMLLSG